MVCLLNKFILIYKMRTGMEGEREEEPSEMKTNESKSNGIEYGICIFFYEVRFFSSFL